MILKIYSYYCYIIINVSDNYYYVYIAQDEQGNNICPDALIPVAMMGVARCNLRLGM